MQTWKVIANIVGSWMIYIILNMHASRIDFIHQFGFCIHFISESPPLKINDNFPLEKEGITFSFFLQFTIPVSLNRKRVLIPYFHELHTISIFWLENDISTKWTDYLRKRCKSSSNIEIWYHQISCHKIWCNINQQLV